GSTQRVAFRVGKQPIDTPGNVPNVKRNRRQPEWTRIELFVIENSAPALKVLARQFQRVEHGSLHRWNLSEGATHPRLRFTHNAIIIGEPQKKRVEAGLARLCGEKHSANAARLSNCYEQKRPLISRVQPVRPAVCGLREKVCS